MSSGSEGTAVRFGFAVGSSLWFAGGLDGGPTDYRPINTAVEMGANGDTLRTIDLPIPDHQFLYASWIGAIDGRITILGTICVLPTDGLGCPDKHPESVAALFQIGSDGAAELTPLPELVVDGSSNRPTRVFRTIGAVGTSLYVEFASSDAKSGGQHAGATIHVFRVDVAARGVVSTTPPATGLEQSDFEGILPFSGLCLAGSTMYSLSYSIDPATSAIGPPSDHLRIRAASVTEEPLSWVDVTSVDLDDSFPARSPTLECSASDVFVDSGSTTLFMRVVHDGQPIEPEIVDLTGMSVHAQAIGDRLLVTVNSGGPTRDQLEAVVWEHHPDTGWTERGRRSGRAMVVEVGTRLVDIWPAASNSPDEGSTLVRPFDG